MYAGVTDDVATCVERSGAMLEGAVRLLVRSTPAHPTVSENLREKEEREREREKEREREREREKKRERERERERGRDADDDGTSIFFFLIF